jgi:hypothetical protein
MAECASCNSASSWTWRHESWAPSEVHLTSVDAKTGTRRESKNGTDSVQDSTILMMRTGKRMPHAWFKDIHGTNITMVQTGCELVQCIIPVRKRPLDQSDCMNHVSTHTANATVFTHTPCVQASCVKRATLTDSTQIARNACTHELPTMVQKKMHVPAQHDARPQPQTEARKQTIDKQRHALHHFAAEDLLHDGQPRFLRVAWPAVLTQVRRTNAGATHLCFVKSDQHNATHTTAPPFARWQRRLPPPTTAPS